MTKQTKCKYVLPLLSDYAEGALTEPEKRTVDEHLSNCEQCKAEASIMAAFVSRLSAIEETAAPSNLCQNVMSSLQKAKSTEKPSIFEKIKALFAQQRLTLVGAVSLCLLLLFIIPNVQKGPNTHVAKAYRSEGGISLTGGQVDLDGVVVDATSGPVHVEKGNTLVIPRGSRVNLQYGDGSIVTASRHAKLDVLGEGLILHKGRLDLSMTKNGIGFIVKTPHADVIVRGTRYSVEVGKATRVHVTQGAVAVESRLGGDELLLKAGDKVSVLPSGDVQTKLVNSPTTPVVSDTKAAGQSEDTSLLGTSDEN